MLTHEENIRLLFGMAMSQVWDLATLRRRKGWDADPSEMPARARATKDRHLSSMIVSEWRIWSTRSPDILAALFSDALGCEYTRRDFVKWAKARSLEDPAGMDWLTNREPAERPRKRGKKTKQTNTP